MSLFNNAGQFAELYQRTDILVITGNISWKHYLLEAGWKSNLEPVMFLVI